MSVPIIKAEKYHGKADLGMSRYFAMYLAQAGWILLGLYLLQNAYWPSSCRPEGLLEVFACSIRLPESRNWVEGRAAHLAVVDADPRAARPLAPLPHLPRQASEIAATSRAGPSPRRT